MLGIMHAVCSHVCVCCVQNIAAVGYLYDCIEHVKTVIHKRSSTRQLQQQQQQQQLGGGGGE